MPDEDQKVIIDEDWKAQVQREKEEAARKTAEAAKESAEAGEDEGAAPEEKEAQASFDALVGSLATQAMFSLGMIAQPGQERVTVNLVDAKFVIDLLIILREKTRGNLSKEEEGGLAEAIADLQRVFVARSQQVQEQAMREAGVDMSALRRE